MLQHCMDILIIRPLVLTEKWRSVNGVRFGDPSVLFGIPNYMDITIKTNRSHNYLCQLNDSLTGSPEAQTR